MRWIYAVADTTKMVELKTFRDWCSEKLIGEAMYGDSISTVMTSDLSVTG